MLRLIVIALVALNVLLIGVQAASEAPAPRAEPAGPPPPLPDVPRLELLTELAPEAFPERSPFQCYTAGPFETVPTMIAAREVLGPQAETVSERETEALVELGYWVSLPSAKSFAEAGTAMQDLQAQGLSDMAVVGDENGDYRVSLGYFLEEANARQRRNEVRALGFEVETRLQRETQTRFWLDYALTDAALAERIADDLPAGQQRKIPCADPVAEERPVSPLISEEVPPLT